MRKKRIIIFLLAFAMLLCLAPMAASAAGNEIDISGEVTIDATGNLIREGVPSVPLTFEDTFNVVGDTVLTLEEGADVTIAGIYIGSAADLTVKGSGTLNVVNSSIAIIISSGSLTVNGGTLSATGGVYAGISIENSSITVNGGTLTVTGTEYNGIRAENSPITVSGGKLSAIGNGFAGIYAYDSPITVESGELTATGDKYAGIYAEDSPIAVSGGTLTAMGYENNNGIYAYGSPITVSGGTLTATGDGWEGISANNNSPIIVSGGTLTATGSNGIGADFNSPITVSGGTLTATGSGEYSDGIYAYNSPITVKNGTLTATSSYNGISIGDSSITVSGGALTATGSNDGIYTYSSPITVSGGTLTATGDNQDGIGVSGNSSITVSGGTLTATGKGDTGIYVYSDLPQSSPTIPEKVSKADRDNNDGASDDDDPDTTFSITVTDGALTATGYYDGIYAPYGDILVTGGVLVGEGRYYDGICAPDGSIIVRSTAPNDGKLVAICYIEGEPYVCANNNGEGVYDKKYTDPIPTWVWPETSETTVVLYRDKQEEVYFTVTYNANAGGAVVSNLPAPAQVKSGTAAARPSPNPTRSGYTFMGWYTKDGKLWNFSTVITADITLYAYWTRDSDIITPTPTPWTIIPGTSTVVTTPAPEPPQTGDSALTFTALALTAFGAAILTFTLRKRRAGSR